MAKKNSLTQLTDFKDFIDILNKHKVDYLIVGAYATIKHTNIARYSKDIDFWIKDSKDNAIKCSQAIKDFISINVNPNDLIDRNGYFTMGKEPHRIDIFVSQGNLDFSEAWTNKLDDKFLNVKAHFISKGDLIKLKEFYDREIDRKDLKRLKGTEIKTDEMKKNIQIIKNKMN